MTAVKKNLYDNIFVTLLTWSWNMNRNLSFVKDQGNGDALLRMAQEVGKVEFNCNWEMYMMINIEEQEAFEVNRSCRIDKQYTEMV